MILMKIPGTMTMPDRSKLDWIEINLGIVDFVFEREMW